MPWPQTRRSAPWPSVATASRPASLWKPPAEGGEGGRTLRSPWGHLALSPFPSKRCSVRAYGWAWAPTTPSIVAVHARKGQSRTLAESLRSQPVRQGVPHAGSATPRRERSQPLPTVAHPLARQADASSTQTTRKVLNRKRSREARAERPSSGRGQANHPSLGQETSSIESRHHRTRGFSPRRRRQSATRAIHHGLSPRMPLWRGKSHLVRSVRGASR